MAAGLVPFYAVYRIIDDIYKPDSVPNIEGKTVNPSCMDEEMDQFTFQSG